MKEVNLHNPAFGKDKKDRDSSVKNIVSELTIIKEQVNAFLIYDSNSVTSMSLKESRVLVLFLSMPFKNWFCVK